MTQYDSNKSETLIDVEALKVNFMGDMDIIKQILQTFLVTYEHFPAEFDTLNKKGDRVELSRLVHGLKGSSANIRAGLLSSQAATLQKSIEQHEDYTQLSEALANTFEQLKKEISALLAD